MPTRIRVVAPGRVNLIGDHTDHTGGWVLPMAIDLATTIECEILDDDRIVELSSDQAGGVLSLPLPVPDPRRVEPGWGRYVAGVAAELGDAARALRGRVTSTVPVGGGLSSSAALTVATALALDGGAERDVVATAALCQRAEQRAVGVPCGIMDPLASLAGIEGHALLIDTTSVEVTPVALPEAAEVVIVDSGGVRALAGSEYADRRRRCEQAAAVVGDLRRASTDDLSDISDAEVRSAGRHVNGENRRVLAAADALARGDAASVGRLMVESHESLRDLLDVSTPAIDRLVEDLCAQPGVHGARLTGAGFGGWVVALTEPGALSVGRVVRASAGASVSG